MSWKLAHVLYVGRTWSLCTGPVPEKLGVQCPVRQMEHDPEVMEQVAAFPPSLVAWRRSILQEVKCDLEDENGHHWREAQEWLTATALSERVTLSLREYCLAFCAILPTGTLKKAAICRRLGHPKSPDGMDLQDWLPQGRLE